MAFTSERPSIKAGSLCKEFMLQGCLIVGAVLTKFPTGNLTVPGKIFFRAIPDVKKKCEVLLHLYL